MLPKPINSEPAKNLEELAWYIHNSYIDVIGSNNESMRILLYRNRPDLDEADQQLLTDKLKYFGNYFSYLHEETIFRGLSTEVQFFEKPRAIYITPTIFTPEIFIKHFSLIFKRHFLKRNDPRYESLQNKINNLIVNHGFLRGWSVEVNWDYIFSYFEQIKAKNNSKDYEAELEKKRLAEYKQRIKYVSDRENAARYYLHNELGLIIKNKPNNSKEMIYEIYDLSTKKPLKLYKMESRSDSHSDLLLEALFHYLQKKEERITYYKIREKMISLLDELFFSYKEDYKLEIKEKITNKSGSDFHRWVTKLKNRFIKFQKERSRSKIYSFEIEDLSLNEPVGYKNTAITIKEKN